MDTRYVKMPELLQYMLASMLSLKDPYDRGDFISFSYTGSQPEYPEKILNLKWGLVGDWRIISFAKLYGKKEGLIKFCELLKFFSNNHDYFERARKLTWLYQISERDGEECSVSGRNFEEGIENLFKKLTTLDSVKIDGEDELFIPSIIIQCTDKKNQHHHGYLYVAEEKTFKNLSWPKETPNYVKAFLEIEQKLALT